MTTIEALEEYTSLDDTALGEAGARLAMLYAYKPYLSEEFFDALELEIERKLADYRDTYIIRVKEETITQIVKTLEWIE